MSKKLKYIYILMAVCTVCCLSLESCTKLVTIPPPATAVTETNVYADDGTATGVLTGLYNNMTFDGYPITGSRSISVLSGLSADELTLYAGVTKPDFRSYCYTNSLIVHDYSRVNSSQFIVTFLNSKSLINFRS